MRRLGRTTGRALGFLALLASLGGLARAEGEEAVIVALLHPDNPAGEVTIHDLRLMYGLYRRAWSGGERVALVLPAPDTASMHFLATKVLRRSDGADVDRYFVQSVFQGRIGREPPKLGTAASIAFVMRNPGAIALVTAEEAAQASSVKVVVIGELEAWIPAASSDQG